MWACSLCCVAKEGKPIGPPCLPATKSGHVIVYSHHKRISLVVSWPLVSAINSTFSQLHPTPLQAQRAQQASRPLASRGCVSGVLESPVASGLLGHECCNPAVSVMGPQRQPRAPQPPCFPCFPCFPCVPLNRPLIDQSGSAIDVHGYCATSGSNIPAM